MTEEQAGLTKENLLIIADDATPSFVQAVEEAAVDNGRHGKT